LHKHRRTGKRVEGAEQKTGPAELSSVRLDASPACGAMFEVDWTKFYVEKIQRQSRKLLDV
jgi:hypothetical protein